MDLLQELDKEFNTGGDSPDFIESVHYLFFEKGIDLIRFNHLPIPYIMNILKTHAYVKEEEKKEIKKSQRKK